MLGTGKGKSEFGTYALSADYLDVFIMSLDNLFCNGKSKPGAFFIFTAGRVRFVEAFPDFFDTFFWDALSGIFDLSLIHI